MAHTVDGIHYPKEEKRPFSTSMSSHKLGGKAGLCYELCVSTHKPQLTWLNGPFPAAFHDKTIFRKALKQAIEQKQQSRASDRIHVIADDGYFAQDLIPTLSFRNEFDPRDLVWFKDRALARHEYFNGLTKTFSILTTPFRHDRGWNPSFSFPMHKACVEAICVTLQYELDRGDLTLFDPYPE